LPDDNEAVQRIWTGICAGWIDCRRGGARTTIRASRVSDWRRGANMYRAARQLQLPLPDLLSQSSVLPALLSWTQRLCRLRVDFNGLGMVCQSRFLPAAHVRAEQGLDQPALQAVDALRDRDAAANGDLKARRSLRAQRRRRSCHLSVRRALRVRAPPRWRSVAARSA
jgi:hypothetical protein